jgi:hypothetical protein
LEQKGQQFDNVKKGLIDMHRVKSTTHIERKRPMRQSVMRWFSKALEDTRKIKTERQELVKKKTIGI